MKIHLIYNPISGKKTNTENIKQIIQYAKDNNIDLITYESKTKDDITNLTKTITNTNEEVNLMVCGGDGSAHDALNGIVNFEKTNLYIFPGGSGNDFAHEIGLYDTNSLVHNFKELVTKGIVKKVDYFLLNNRVRSLNEVSFGISAQVLLCMAKLKHFSPRAKYTIASIKKGLFYKNYKFKVSCILNDNNKEEFFVTSPLMTLANGPYSGSGLQTAPGAIIDDGLITLSYVKKFPHLFVLSVIMKMRKGKFGSCKYHVSKNAKEINVTLLDVENGVYASDGVIFEHQKEANIKVVPGQLKVVTLPK